MKNFFKFMLLMVCFAEVALVAAETQKSEGLDIHQVIACRKCKGCRGGKK